MCDMLGHESNRRRRRSNAAYTAARAVTQLYNQELRPTGLELTQFTLVMALNATGEVTQGKLGQRLVIDSTTLTRSLAPLRAQGKETLSNEMVQIQ